MLIFSTSTVFSAALADGPIGYTLCASEGQSFALPGVCDVAYGAKGEYSYKYKVSNTITFNKTTFGDPKPGTRKSGYYKVITAQDVQASGTFSEYDARISEKEILTPPEGKAPRINGPKVYGARPDKLFVYRIPCQGERPMQFTVADLPDGLLLDAKQGILTGRTPAQKGGFEMTFKAKNTHGEAKRSFKLIVGQAIALTPPTGWNSWGGHMLNVSDALMRKVADVFVDRGLADVGFQYVGIDDCWMRLTQEMYDGRSKAVIGYHKGVDYTDCIGPIRDEDGNILPNVKFPDMKAMTDYIHSKGLKAGIYSGPGPQTCQQWAGSYKHERADADQYGRWGFDLLKYDLCSGCVILRALKKLNPGYKPKDFWKPMSDALQEQDRDILFNLCQYGRDRPGTWAPSIGIQTWRTGGDLNHHVDQYFKYAIQIATKLRQYNKPGQWNDPDFMYIHRVIDAFHKAKPSEEISLDTNQRYQYVSLWSIICAPFFFSCDIETIDDFTVGILANADVLNISQDELGHTAELIRNKKNIETVMMKKLADGSVVVALFNRDSKNERVVSVEWEELDLCCEMGVHDVWRQKDIGMYKGGISVKLSPNGVGLFRIGG